jgi:hypothetical protein
MCIAGTPLVRGAVSEVLLPSTPQFTWQAFEDLELLFLHTLIRSFIAMGINEAALRDIWSSAQGNSEVNNIRLSRRREIEGKTPTYLLMWNRSLTLLSKSLLKGRSQLRVKRHGGYPKLRRYSNSFSICFLLFSFITF